MANTALGAKREKVTHTITFKNKEHEKFYFEYLPECRYQGGCRWHIMSSGNLFCYRRFLATI